VPEGSVRGVADMCRRRVRSERRGSAGSHLEHRVEPEHSRPVALAAVGTETAVAVVSAAGNMPAVAAAESAAVGRSPEQ